MTLDELLTLSLPDRIRWLRSPEGPQGSLSHDRFAKLLGTTRQTVIGWEKRGVEPRLYADKLAAFSGFPAAAFLRREAETLPTVGPFGRLEELAGKVLRLGETQETLLTDLADARKRIERLEAARTRRRGDSTRQRQA